MKNNHVPALCLAALLSTLQAMALQVTVTAPHSSQCDLPYGVLFAQASGGTPPYSYAWSTGATTELIDGLYPGTYTVTVNDFLGTEAMADGIIESPALFPGGAGLVMPQAVHCPGSLPEANLVLPFLSSYGYPSWGLGPHSIVLDGTVVSSTYVPCVSCIDDQVGFYRIQVNAPPGSYYYVNWVDANGCPGASDVWLSEEAQWPTVQVLDEQGACSGGANGGFNVLINPSAGQSFGVLVRDALGGIVGPQARFHATPQWQRTFSGLAAGDYHVILISDRYGPYDDEACADTTTITIPDLGSTCGEVSGRVFIDGDANCTWAGNENTVPGAIVEFTPGPLYASTSSNGTYAVHLPLGTYDHGIIHPAAQQECDGPTTVNSNITRNIGCSSLFPLDVQVSLASGVPRPGFGLRYGMNLRNNTVANAGSTTLTLEIDPVLVLGTAVPAPTSVVGNTLTWVLPGVNAYANLNYIIDCTVPPDIGLVGSQLNATAAVSTTDTDGFPANNIADLSAMVVASYDPNDKVARTSSAASDALYFINEDEWIDYTIRFQNTGTAAATFIVITDTLPATLDPARLAVGAASNAMSWELEGQGILRFVFPSINLPDSGANEPASHGFVSFRIRPREPLLAGTVIENTAIIYFDYNEPVITEPSVLVAEFSTSISEQVGTGLQVFPNPTYEHLVATMDDGTIAFARVLSVDGRQALSVAGSGQRIALDLNELVAGTYLLQLEMIGGTVLNQRIIKQ